MTREEYRAWYLERHGTIPPEDDAAGCSDENEPDTVELPTPIAAPRECDTLVPALLDHWADLFRRRYGLKYRAGHKSEKLDAIEFLLYELCEGNKEKARRAITILFTHKKLHWLNDISLIWLTNESNFTRFIVPLLTERSRGKKADWNRPRAKQPTIRIRRRRV